MNKINLQLLPFLSMLILIGCSKDDDVITDNPGGEGDSPVLIDNTAPEFLSQSFEIDENIAIDSSLGFLVATDKENDDLSYKLIDVDVPFAVNEFSGEITVSNEIDFEAEESYEFKVAVNDGEFTTQTTITISVKDIIESTLSEEEQERLMEIATYVILDKSDTPPNLTVRKWGNDIKLFLTEDFPSSDRDVVVDFLETLKGFNTVGLNIQLVDSEEQANIVMFRSAYDEIKDVRPDFGSTPSSSNLGVAYTKRNSVNIVESVIWINSEKSDKAVFKHELLHALGLGHSDDENSLMYPSNKAKLEGLSADDVFVLEALYSNQIKGGLNEDELELALQAYFQTI